MALRLNMRVHVRCRKSEAAAAAAATTAAGEAAAAAAEDYYSSLLSSPKLWVFLLLRELPS